jgi:deoxyribonuclease V
LRLDRLIRQQEKTATHVKVSRHNGKIRTVAGADVALNGDYLSSCIGVFSYPALELCATSCARMRASMPYVPGFLSYRELPVLVKAYRKLTLKPDVIIVDGQGIAHPRGLGLASHLGIVLNVSTIGCAKSHLFGEYKVPRSGRGSYSAVLGRGRRIGIVLRTRDNVKPLYVSPGHLVDFDDCLRIVLGVTKGYRLPEPVRYAHRMAGLTARSML